MSSYIQTYFVRKTVTKNFKKSSNLVTLMLMQTFV